MSDKILDIIPPRETTHTRSEPEKEKFWSVGKIVLLAVAVVFGVGLFSYFNFAKAEIKIRPRFEKMESERLVTVKEAATEISEDTIPGEIISVQVKGSEQFGASEIDKEQKARGEIRLYNNATRNITLRRRTRFMSASQQVYLADNRVTIPAAQWRGGEKQPGHVDITVTAAEPGKDYNAEDTKFSVPGLNGTRLYHQIYAETVSKIEGGFKGKTYQVTEEGVEKAKESLKNKLAEKSKNQLKEKNYNIIPGTFVQNVTDTFVSAQPGMRTDKFTVQRKVKTEAFAFKESSLRTLVEKLAQKKIEDGEIDDSSLSVDYEIRETYPDQNRALINVKYSAKVYSPVDEKELKREIQGMSLMNLYSWLDRKKSIAEMEVTTWPQWLSSLPSDQDRVDIKVLTK